ncbi:hypothetical protein G9U52_23850 [Paenibacillus sp. S3N08]|uniref:Lipoprotein n=2 Tax=Paenibacillus agricola TaxID=2716264 RepID=A0ABX0JAS0_9BACL|nr:hypothetical protein [Paenibacillus agricola]
MEKKKAMIRSGIMLLGIIMVILSACTKQETQNTASEPVETNHILTIANNIDVDMFDTHNTTNVVTESVVVKIQSYLLKRDFHYAAKIRRGPTFLYRCESKACPIRAPAGTLTYIYRNGSDNWKD